MYSWSVFTSRLATWRHSTFRLNIDSAKLSRKLVVLWLFVLDIYDWTYFGSSHFEYQFRFSLLNIIHIGSLFLCKNQYNFSCFSEQNWRNNLIQLIFSSKKNTKSIILSARIFFNSIKIWQPKNNHENMSNFTSK